MNVINEQTISTDNESLEEIGLSIIIPVYNEEALLASAIKDLHDKLESLNWDYELLISENGSTDRTKEAIKELENKYSQVRGIYTNKPNYGLALRNGIKEARGTYVICDEIDICDTVFYQRALSILKSDTTDIVIGSKRHPDAQDHRPWLRRLATTIVNLLLNILLGFKGTDTHGLKALNRKCILPIVEHCIVDKDIFATELVIRGPGQPFSVPILDASQFQHDL